MNYWPTTGRYQWGDELTSSRIAHVFLIQMIKQLRKEADPEGQRIRLERKRAIGAARTARYRARLKGVQNELVR